MKKRILIIFGTRPEAIKLAPVIDACRKVREFETIVCSTGQHREMLQQVLDIFTIRVDMDLSLMKGNQDLFDITSGALLQLRDYFTLVKPDVVIVQGDTTTAFASALAAFYLKIKVAHVEAGLRSYNIFSPYPEEVNRRCISTLADFHFVPTNLALKNLQKEHFPAAAAHVTGNTVVDALLRVKRALKGSQTVHSLSALFSGASIPAPKKNEFILLTLHRREKFGAEFSSVLDTLVEIAREYPALSFVYPVHLNPNVKGPVQEKLSAVSNFVLLPPLDYLSFVFLMKQCRFIISDSGGIQEECYTFRKPILVLRDVTERMEAVKAGYAFLLGSDKRKIKDAFKKVDKKIRRKHDFFPSTNPYGDGKSAKRIASILRKSLITK